MTQKNISISAYSQAVYSPLSKVPIERRSTKSQTPIRQQQHVNLVHDICQNENVEPPSPFNSSKQEQSVQVKYLSYLVQVIDSAPQRSQNPSSSISSHYSNAQYWQVIYESAIYVKKDKFRTQIDDNLFSQQISGYFKPNRIHPEPISEIGEQILRNGYFLIAYCILTGRKRKSCFIFKYLMQHFMNQRVIQANKQEYMYVVENYIDKDRVEQFLNLQMRETPGQQQQKQYQKRQQNNNKLLIKRGIPSNNNYKNSLQDQFSEQDQVSRTIILQDQDSRSYSI